MPRRATSSSPTARRCPASAATRRATSSSSSAPWTTSCACRCTSTPRCSSGSSATTHRTSCNQDNVADCWTALEGVSHFLCVAHNAGHDRPVSRLTLELQAEIDKYVASFLLLRRQSPQRFPAELHTLLFRRARIDPALAAGRESLYRRASRYAARFCARLEPRLRALRLADDGSWLGELRRFYRLSDFGKLRHIERLASA